MLCNSYMRVKALGSKLLYMFKTEMQQCIPLMNFQTPTVLILEEGPKIGIT